MCKFDVDQMRNATCRVRTKKTNKMNTVMTRTTKMMRMKMTMMMTKTMKIDDDNK